MEDILEYVVANTTGKEFMILYRGISPLNKRLNKYANRLLHNKLNNLSMYRFRGLRFQLFDDYLLHGWLIIGNMKIFEFDKGKIKRINHKAEYIHVFYTRVLPDKVIITNEGGRMRNNMAVTNSPSINEFIDKRSPLKYNLRSIRVARMTIDKTRIDFENKQVIGNCYESILDNTSFVNATIISNYPAKYYYTFGKPLIGGLPKYTLVSTKKPSRFTCTFIKDSCAMKWGKHCYRSCLGVAYDSTENILLIHDLRQCKINKLFRMVAHDTIRCNPTDV
jgi:hypothetical protein